MHPSIKTFLPRLWYEWRGVVYFILVMLLFRSAIADWNQVPSGSMKPSILAGDRLVVDKISYDLRVPFTLTRITQWDDPKRGDIVTFPNPQDERLFVKRVIGVPGDIVELKRNKLTINGETAQYTELDREVVAEFQVDGKSGYRFLVEAILGSERIIMIRKGGIGSKHATFEALEIPVDHYMLLGDNRDRSSDSRVIGLIERERIIGRAHAIAFSYGNYFVPRFERFFTDLE